MLDVFRFLSAKAKLFAKHMQVLEYCDPTKCLKIWTLQIEH